MLVLGLNTKLSCIVNLNLDIPLTYRPNRLIQTRILS